MATRRITIRDAKGGKDRVTMLPVNLANALERHLQKVKTQHEQDLEDGFGGVYLPEALARMGMAIRISFNACFFRSAPRAERSSTGEAAASHRRSALQLAVKKAVRASGINKPASYHTLRHSFATHLLENGYDIDSFAAPLSRPLGLPVYVAASQAAPFARCRNCWVTRM